MAPPGSSSRWEGGSSRAVGGRRRIWKVEGEHGADYPNHGPWRCDFPVGQTRAFSPTRDSGKCVTQPVWRVYRLMPIANALIIGTNRAHTSSCDHATRYILRCEEICQRSRKQENNKVHVLYVIISRSYSYVPRMLLPRRDPSASAKSWHGQILGPRPKYKHSSFQLSKQLAFF